jgi:hypothetical protein
MKKYLNLLLSVALTMGLFVLPTMASAQLTAALDLSNTNTAQSISEMTIHTGDYLTMHIANAGILGFDSDHCIVVSIVSVEGLISNNTQASYLIADQGLSCTASVNTDIFSGTDGYSASLLLWRSITPGTLVIHIDSIVPNPGEAADTPVPTNTPTITHTPNPGSGSISATLPSLLPSQAVRVTPIAVQFPTAKPNGIFGQGGLYTAPTAVALANTNYNFGFSLSNEVALANGAISMYKTANSGGAINILLLIFLAFAGLSILFALIKKLGNR